MSIKAKTTAGFIILAVILAGSWFFYVPKQAKVELRSGKVLVTVNETTITQSQVDGELAPYLERAASMGREIPEAQKMRLQKERLNIMIEKQLLSEKIKSESISVTSSRKRGSPGPSSIKPCARYASFTGSRSVETGSSTTFPTPWSRGS